MRFGYSHKGGCLSQPFNTAENQVHRFYSLKIDAFAKTRRMAKQKLRPTRLGDFSGAKAYSRHVEVLKKRCNAVGLTFCDAINIQ
jgi:hypothetical protein